MRVETPGKTYIRKQYDFKYVYFYTNHYRIADNKIRHSAILIGKVDSETGKAILNSRYFEIFDDKPQKFE